MNQKRLGDFPYETMVVVEYAIGKAGEGRTASKKAVLGEDGDGVDDENDDCKPCKLRSRMQVARNTHRKQASQDQRAASLRVEGGKMGEDPVVEGGGLIR